jgi:hypothetical protein
MKAVGFNQELFMPRKWPGDTAASPEAYRMAQIAYTPHDNDYCYPLQIDRRSV